MKYFILIVLSGFFHFAHAEITPVSYVDLSQYAGTWYQIARNPLFFEDGCVCSRQVLSPNQDGTIGVYNSCNSNEINGPLKEIRGYAVNDDPNTNARFTVDFGLPHKGQYWIIGLQDEYKYAVVSDPSGLSLYILSKTPTLEAALYDEALTQAATQVDTSKIAKTIQDGCAYPE